MSNTSNGPVNGVKCPHCGKPNDFRVLHDQQLLDTGHKVSCDHCKQIMEVTRIAPVLVVTVRQAVAGERPRPRGQLAPARQARTLSPAETRKLLGRR